jgi:hypothetical protein
MRRPDVTPDNRLQMAAAMALNPGRPGLAPFLAARHGVSRQFAYCQLWILQEAFAVRPATAPAAGSLTGGEVIVDPAYLSLSMLLVAQSSMADIHRLLAAIKAKASSLGHVSGLVAKAGAALPDEKAAAKGDNLVGLGDEVFSGSSPIMVVMDADSGYIMRVVVAPDRSGETWAALLEELKREYPGMTRINSDQGSGLCAGIAMAGLEHFPDLLHLLMPFVPWLGRLERRAYAALEAAAGRERVFLNAKSEGNLARRLGQVETARELADAAVARYDSYAYLWACLQEAFRPFDGQGRARTVDAFVLSLNAAADLMEEFVAEDAMRKAANGLRKAAAEYSSYFKRLGDVVARFAGEVKPAALAALCLAWQLGKKAASSDWKRKKELRGEAGPLLLQAQAALGEGFEAVRGKVFAALDHNSRSSSPVESVNSIIRNYLNNVKGQAGQHALDLLKYHLNHRLADRGPNKGSSAYQRFTGNAEPSDPVTQILGYMMAA